MDNLLRRESGSVCVGIQEAGEILGIANWQVYDWAQRELIPGWKVGRKWRFRRQSLEEWARKQEQEKTGETFEVPSEESIRSLHKKIDVLQQQVQNLSEKMLDNGGWGGKK